MKNKIEDLRNHLFATLESLQDKEQPMDIERARAIADVAQVIVNSAKVEVDFVRATERANGTDFMDPEVRPALPKAGPKLVGSQ